MAQGALSRTAADRATGRSPPNDHRHDGRLRPARPQRRRPGSIRPTSSCSPGRRSTSTRAARRCAARTSTSCEPGSSPAGGFEGVDRLLLISAHDLERRAGQHLAAIDAAKAAGVRHVVYTSVPNPTPENPAAVVPSHRATEEALRESGMAWTMLRNNIYAEFQGPVGAQARAAGRLYTSVGEGRIAFVSREDCAAAAAAVLTQDGHEGRPTTSPGPRRSAPPTWRRSPAPRWCRSTTLR